MAVIGSCGRPLSELGEAENLGALGRELAILLCTPGPFAARRAEQLSSEALGHALRLYRSLRDTPRAA